MKFQNWVFTGKGKLNTDYYREVNAEIRGISLKDYRLGGWEWDEMGHREQEERNGRWEEKEKSVP